MKRAVLLGSTLSLTVILVVVALLAGAAPPAQVEGQTTEASTELQNGAFEGVYAPWQGSEDRYVAPDWSLWYADTWHNEPDLRAPHTDAAEGANARSGQAQGMHGASIWNNFNACVYQRIEDLTPGHVLQFSAWAKVEAHEWLRDPDKMQTWLGIDLDGGTDPREINYYTHPANWDTYTDYGQWQNLSVTLHATSPTATLYLCAHPTLAREFHAYWDNAEFTVTPGAVVYMPFMHKAPCRPDLRTLGNPDMEESFCEIEGYQTYLHYENILVAPWWTPFWNDDFVPETGENRQPEFGPTDRDYRLYSGRVSQQIGISGGGAFEAGVYQIVWGTYPGDVVRFRMWGMGWNQYWPSVNPVDERVSDYQGEGGLRFRIGIDPYGGEDYTSPNIVWSDMVDPYDAWHRFEVVTTARADHVSVWLYAHPSRWEMRWNESFWDGGEFDVLDQPSLGFSQDAYSVDESAGTATLTVTLDSAFALPVTVEYATADQSAQAPGDYAADSGTLTFAPGTTTQTIEIEIADDTLDEPDETLQVTLSNPTNAALQGTNPAVLTILDDDEAPVYAPPCDEGNAWCEENDRVQEAYGPLALGAPYSAYPDDAADYYRFTLDSSTTMTVTLSDYAPTGEVGTLSLYGPAAGEDTGDLVEATGPGPETTLSLGPHALEAGTYYVLIETDEVAWTDTVTYTLTVQE